MIRFFIYTLIILVSSCTARTETKQRKGSQDTPTSVILSQAATQMKELQGRFGEKIYMLKHYQNAFSRFKCADGDTIYVFDYVIEDICHEHQSQILYLYWTSHNEMYGEFEKFICTDKIPEDVVEEILNPVKQEVAEFEEWSRLNNGKTKETKYEEDNNDINLTDWVNGDILYDVLAPKKYYEYLYRIIIKGDTFVLNPIRVIKTQKTTDK